MTGSAPRWKYILAFVLASVLTNFLAVLVDVGMSRGMKSGEAQTALLYMPFIGVAVSLGVWAGVLKLFSSLIPARMFPWIATLGLLGTAVSVGRLHSQMEWMSELLNSKADVSVMVYVMPFIAYGVFLILFRRLFCRPNTVSSVDDSET